MRITTMAGVSYIEPPKGSGANDCAITAISILTGHNWAKVRDVVRKISPKSEKEGAEMGAIAKALAKLADCEYFYLEVKQKNYVTMFDFLAEFPNWRGIAIVRRQKEWHGVCFKDGIVYDEYVPSVRLMEIKVRAMFIPSDDWNKFQAEGGRL